MSTAMMSTSPLSKQHKSVADRGRESTYSDSPLTDATVLQHNDIDLVQKNSDTNQTDEVVVEEKKNKIQDLQSDTKKVLANEEEDDKFTSSDKSPSTNNQYLQNEVHEQDTLKRRRKIRRSNNVVSIQNDASIAFSPYHQPPTTNRKAASQKKKKRGETSSKNSNAHVPLESKLEKKGLALADNTEAENFHYAALPQHLADTDSTSMLQTVNDDPILKHYLPILTFLNDNFYTKIKPYRIGRRNLPQNQIELILRRRAVKKKQKKRIDSNDDDTCHYGNAAAAAATITTNQPNDKGQQRQIYQQQRPPLSPSRRKLFQHFDNDSSISSATATSSKLLTEQSIDSPTQANILQDYSSSRYPTQHYSSLSTPLPLPQEELVGDTSLGLKLIILQGKVIIQRIDPLNDGRASPAQLCGGLISAGDIIIAVNGKSLINGTIHNPAPIDRIISVLQPLSQPIDEDSGEFSREVRLRLVLAEGIDLLREQKQRDKKRREDMELRKQLGLERRTSGDAAGDIFGIASFMAVDQHSGMPLFVRLDHKHYHDHVSKTTPTLERRTLEGMSNGIVDDAEERNEKNLINHSPRQVQAPLLTLQERIARQVALDRQWIRNQNTSEFFSLDKDASALLRPLTPPPSIDEINTFEDPIEARKQMLERGAKFMNDSKSLVSIAESEDRHVEGLYADEDPMEVASRVCGTASIRTGASKRRWHRGDCVVAEEDSSAADDKSSAADNMSMESAEECDHRRLIFLAASDDSWKVNVLKRLKEYAQNTEKESNGGISQGIACSSDAAPTTFDTILFGRGVTSLIGKKKRSLALPPGEITAMLFDLVVHLSADVLPGQIFIDNEFGTGNKAVSFSRNLGGSGDDIKKATEFLLNEALDLWLKTFRPLPLTQRRALWPNRQSAGGFDASMVASTLDDNMSLSMASGSVDTMKTTATEREKRNLREVIEEIELDSETRTETCRLVTFYFTRKCATQKVEEELATLVDTHGAYLDLHQCLVAVGKIHSKLLIEKLLEVAKYDSHHKESLKHLNKGKELMLIFYEPQMLSSILEILSSSSVKSDDFDLTALLVSAYPDLQPWCVREICHMENANSFYFKYLSSLLHYDEGNDAARRDKELVKEWCLMQLQQEETVDEDERMNRESFLHISSRNDENSILYHRDLPFLMDISTKMSEFGLALDIANEIISSTRYRHNKQVLEDVVKHLRMISDVAIKDKDGDLNTTLLSNVITSFNVLAPCMEKHHYELDIISELTQLLEQCRIVGAENSSYDFNNMNACITCVSESAPPSISLQVFSQWKHSSIESPSFVTAIQTCLFRGACDGVRNELSGSLLRIKRAREEGRRPLTENEMASWDAIASVGGADESDEEMDEESGRGGFIWKKVVDGTLQIAK